MIKEAANHVRVEKRWGCEVWWANTDKYMGKTLVINPNQCTSVHYHKDKDETMLVIRGLLIVYEERDAGNGKVKVSSNTFGEGDTVYVEPTAHHRLTAGPEGVTLIEVSTPHPDDSVRVKL